MTLKIKFSHEHTKFPYTWDDSWYILLAVFKTHYNELGKEFIVYDTEYFTDNEVGHYKLPKTDLLVLLFEGGWTTIRRWTQQKEKYYRSKIGELFEIEVIY